MTNKPSWTNKAMKTLGVALLVLATVQQADAATLTRTTPQIPPDCDPQTAPLGASPGRYPPDGTGAPVYRLVDHSDNFDGTDDLVNFNLTKNIGPLVALLVSPFHQAPGDRYTPILIGTVDPNGGILPLATGRPTGENGQPATRAPNVDSATHSPTKQAGRTASPTRQTGKTAAPTKSTAAPTEKGATLAPTNANGEPNTKAPTKQDGSTGTPTNPNGQTSTKTPTTVTGGPGRLLEDDEERRNLRTNERDLNIFLPDTRQEVNIFAYPYRAVGKWRGCTASLVLDSGIIVTNAHCLNYLADGSMDPAMWTQTFYAGFKNGNFLASSQPKAIWYDKGADYAVLKLWSSLDASLGRLGVWWRDTSFFNTNRPLYMISYSGDFCSSWNNCRSKLSNGESRGTTWLSDEVKHDLDATRGSSGSAMWYWYSGVPVMDALNHAENRNGGDVSLTLPSYTGSNPNYCKPAGEWKVGYDHVKSF